MNDLKFGYSKSIFACYCGLVASGYDIGDTKYSDLIIEIRDKIKMEAPCMQYFSKARISTDQINPYWPKGFMMTIGCLYLDHFGVIDGVDVVIETNDQISSTFKTKETIDWIKELPQMIAIIQSLRSFNEIWIKFNDSIVPNIGIDCSQIIENIQKKVGVLANDITFNAIINPLQAYEIADFLSLNNTKYIIISRIDEGSIIHEYLHVYFDKAIQICNPITDDYTYLLDCVYDAMYKNQYTMGNRIESWRRVYEENFVRAATIWVMHDQCDQVRNDQVNMQVQSGFFYVKPIVQCFDRHWRKKCDIQVFWKLCLEACTRNA